jgi:hypothetical protein
MMAGFFSFGQRTIATQVNIGKPTTNTFLSQLGVFDPEYTITIMGPDTLMPGDTILFHDSRNAPGTFYPLYYNVKLAPGTVITLNKLIEGPNWPVRYDTNSPSPYPVQVRTLFEIDDKEIENPPARTNVLKKFRQKTMYAWFIEVADIRSKGKINAINYISSGLKKSMDTVHVITDGDALSVVDVSVIAAQPLNLFPNPSNGLISFEHQFMSGNNVSLSVLDMFGRVVLQKDLSNNFGFQKIDVDLSSLQNNTYYLRLQSGTEVHSGKFLLNR